MTSALSLGEVYGFGDKSTSRALGVEQLRVQACLLPHDLAVPVVPWGSQLPPGTGWALQPALRGLPSAVWGTTSVYLSVPLI